MINSLGACADGQATGLLCRRLSDSEPQVIAAAASALGKIASPESAQALKQALATVPSASRAALGEACLTCAETSLRRGDMAQAVDVFQGVRQADVPEHQRRAAVRGVILAQQPPGYDLLVSLMRSESEADYLMALCVGRELPGREVTDVLVSQLQELTPQRRVPVIALLGDRQDATALPAVLGAAGSDQPALRVAALRALAKLGSASNAPLMLAAATDSDASVAAAARDALVVMDDPELSAVILRELKQADGPVRVCLIDLVSQRRINDALPLLLQASSDPALEVRVAAIKALGKTAPAEQLATLTAVLVKPTTTDDLAAARTALQAACVRLADRESCAAELSQCLPTVSGDLRHFLLDLLGTVGGTTALRTVSQAAFDSDEAVQDTATRVLGEWMSPQAAPVLLEVAEKSANEKFQIRAPARIHPHHPPV